MSKRIYADITQGKTFIHFCETTDISTLGMRFPAWWRDIAVFDLDGASIHSTDELFKAFASALRKPKGWYDSENYSEEYAPNANAFLEYLDDVHEWVPATGHVVLLKNAEQFWRNNARLAGMLIEWWQFATGPRESDIHLVFVW
jgi:hypothetical protein